MLKTPDLDNHTPTLSLEKYSRATLLPRAITPGANKKSLHRYLVIWGKLTGAIRVPCLVLVGRTLKATRSPRGQLISTLAGLQRAALRPGIAPPPHFLWIRKAACSPGRSAAWKDGGDSKKEARMAKIGQEPCSRARASFRSDAWLSSCSAPHPSLTCPQLPLQMPKPCSAQSPDCVYPGAACC